MYPEDRVLVGVINRRRDLELLLARHWYRVPYQRMPEGFDTDYLAFFMSGQAGRAMGQSGIHYYARLRGIELHPRHAILPEEPAHPRLNEWYYLCQLDTICLCQPCVTNPTRRTVTFIYTTWDRFLNAKTLTDLYSTEGYFVSRVRYALPRSFGR